MVYKFGTAFVFILISFLHLSAQKTSFNYSARWKKVDSLINKKGLTESALSEVNGIYAQAKKEKNQEQLIKALIYRINLGEAKQEDATAKSIADLNREIQTATEPSKSILLSIQAELYLNYLQFNRYRIYDRTKTVQYRQEDISSWGPEDFFRKVSALYLESIQKDKILKATRIQSYEAIIIAGNTRPLRPTFFDLLAHRALNYLKNDESDITNPTYAFEIRDSVAFAKANVFVNTHFVTRDSLSAHYKALQVFQQLIAFHLNDANPDALIDVDIERISFVNSYGLMENKSVLYLDALSSIYNEYKNNAIAASAGYLQAQYFVDEASTYDPIKDTSHRFVNVEALKICREIMQQKDISEGKSNCIALFNEIMTRNIMLQAEKVNVPGKPFRVLVTYKNLVQVHFRVIKLDQKFLSGYLVAPDDSLLWMSLIRQKPLRTFNQDLPDTKDFQEHRVEIKVDAVETGSYALLVSAADDFSIEKNILAANIFYVSNISFINNGQDYFVLNRETGQPLPNANVQAWYTYYDNNQHKTLKRKGDNFNTNKNGYFNLIPPKTRDYNHFDLEFSTTNDQLYIQDESSPNYYIQRQYGSNEVNRDQSVDYETTNKKTFIFTDRSIYRPGQIVFFKGIVTTKDAVTKRPKIIPAYKVRLYLYDPNHSKLDSLELTSNEFGSYHGQFKLPQSILTGDCSIEGESIVYPNRFSVEEYKRPKFSVEYDSPKGEYRLNDSVTVVGIAKAYAGNNIDGASIKYRVTRNARFPYPWFYDRGRFPQNNKEQIISFGEMKTGSDGKFRISFKAIPDPSIAQDLNPVFTYQVIADITDINGETRTGEISINVGYRALDLIIHPITDQALSADSFKVVTVRSQNLAGTFEATQVSLAIYALKSPGRLIRKRYWEQPDQFVMTREEYLINFPNDEYSNESHKESWDKLGKVYEGISGAPDKEAYHFNVLSTIGQSSQLKAGWYLVEATAKDKYEQSVKSIQYIQLFDTKSDATHNWEYLWTSSNSQTVEPGQTAHVMIGTGAEDVFLIQQTDRNAISYDFLHLNRETRDYPFPIADINRGGFGLQYAFVKNNRIFTNIQTIHIPWTNKELNISYASFRDKVLPGSEEKWMVKITGNTSEKQSAELLTSMYDASLDQFRPQQWQAPGIYPLFNSRTEWGGWGNFVLQQSANGPWNEVNENSSPFEKKYDQLLPISVNNVRIVLRGAPSYNFSIQTSKGLPSPAVQGYVGEASAKTRQHDVNLVYDKSPSKQEESPASIEKIPPASIQIRKNFNETAFFFPDLRTDDSGNVSFSFIMPEALTQWKWMSFAHTRDLSLGYTTSSVITQKTLMVQPNIPRFIRQGDHLDLPVKIVNLSDSSLTGQAQLQLIDPSTNQSVDGWFSNMQPNQYFTAAAGQSTIVSFPIQVPFQYSQALTYRIFAKSGNFSDGEEAAIPVLTNRVMVTESMPLNMNAASTKKFKFQKLLESGDHESISQYALTIEFTANPAWYAIQALPYLMEFPYECAEQVFNRFYANALASKIAHSSPRIRQVFERWKNDSSALMSKLEKDEELKSVLLQETPWVMQAKSETEQKKNLALLLDANRMNAELESALSKLISIQEGASRFPWFKGGPSDRYITQYILSGFGHLRKLDAWPPATKTRIENLCRKNIEWLDQQILADFAAEKKKKKLPGTKPAANFLQIQYLYLRSFFTDYPIPAASKQAIDYYRNGSKQSWLQQNKYMQGMIALSLYRSGDAKTAKDILASLKQSAIVSEEMGMYWKDNNPGYYWYQAPVETQALLIEAFSEINKDIKTVNDLKTWLLRQKQTQQWSTTKSTADACYALLLQGSDWLAANPSVQINLGDQSIHSDNGVAGEGYLKQSINAAMVRPSMGNINVSIKPDAGATASGSPAWGAIYWQYFEDIDKITSSTPGSNPVKLSKKLFIKKTTDRGTVLEPLIENGYLKIGDRITVRIELRSDRELEYVHMKDMRASCMEPVNVMSGYKWQGALGYYEATKDASTNFFFTRIPKGTYVFEYDLLVSTAGSFSNGITTAQCMYAPEFMSHSEGIRVNVEE